LIDDWYCHFILCTDQVIGCDDMDKRKVGGQEVNTVVVYGSGVLRVHSRRLWKWRSTAYIIGCRRFVCHRRVR